MCHIRSTAAALNRLKGLVTCCLSLASEPWGWQAKGLATLAPLFLAATAKVASPPLSNRRFFALRFLGEARRISPVSPQKSKRKNWRFELPVEVGRQRWPPSFSRRPPRLPPRPPNSGLLRDQMCATQVLKVNCARQVDF